MSDMFGINAAIVKNNADAMFEFDGSVSPYAAAKIVNAYLEALGSAKILPPQMFYTYVKKGYIVSTDGKVNANQLSEWFEKYAAKNLK